MYSKDLKVLLITFFFDPGSINKMVVHFDADWTGYHDTHDSTSGFYVFFFYPIQFLFPLNVNLLSLALVSKQNIGLLLMLCQKSLTFILSYLSISFRLQLQFYAIMLVAYFFLLIQFRMCTLNMLTLIFILCMMNTLLLAPLRFFMFLPILSLLT